MSNATNNEVRNALFCEIDEAFAAEKLTQYELRCAEAEIEALYPENDEPAELPR